LGSQGEQIQRRTSTWVRLLAPPGIAAVQTFSGRRLDIHPDGSVEMSAEDAQYLIHAEWTNLKEWAKNETP
jgi:hypothetical protein